MDLVGKPTDAQDTPALIDLLQLGARANPNGVALARATGPALTFDELLAVAGRLRDRLDALDVPRGGCVVIVCENNVFGVVALFAASLHRCVSVPVNARFTPSELAHVEQEVLPDATLFAVEGSHAAQAHAAARTTQAVVGVDGLFVDLPEARGRQERETFADGTALVLFTSGTTGVPKGVMHSAEGIIKVAAFERGYRSISPQDRVYCTLPLSHIFGLSGLLLPYLSGGATVELAARFDADAVLQRLSEGAITHFLGVPTMYAALVASARRSGLAPKGIRSARTGGSALDPLLAEQAAQLFGLALANGYGATEMSPICRSNGAGGIAVGKPAAGTELRIAGPAGEALAPGETGEIWARGPHRMLGYYKAPEATASVLRDPDWYATGDLGFIDASGSLNIRGRLKEVINRSGFNVYPAEVEAALANHIDVARCAVIGVPLEGGDEQVVAIVEPVPGRTPRVIDLADHMKERLTGYKRPSRYVLVQALPIGPTGKVLKVALKRLVADIADFPENGL
jgi:long-chain acyl-CoA synthetase